MKKCIFGLLIFAAGFSLFAQTEKHNISIFLQPVTGVGHNLNDSVLITEMLSNEIKARNYISLKGPLKADFLVYGALIPYYKYELDRVKTTPAATTYSFNASMKPSWDEPRYVFQLTLRNARTKETLLQQNLTYASFDDVYNFFPVIMHNLFAKIDDVSIDRSIDDWQNKWVYVRFSFDFPITFYQLQGKGLIRGKGIYGGSEEENNLTTQLLDNRVIALPAGTMGIEFQFLDWWSIEPKVQLGWEYLNDTDFMNMAAGLEMKFPIKFRNIMLEPYGAVTFPLLTRGEIFNSFPIVGFGGGLQFGMKGGKAGALFVDANYMYYYGDVGIKNHFGEKYPNPPVIYYQRSVIGLGVGYKLGAGNRRPPDPYDVKSK